jgi:hypothetical protein
VGNGCSNQAEYVYLEPYYIFSHRVKKSTVSEWTSGNSRFRKIGWIPGNISSGNGMEGAFHN